MTCQVHFDLFDGTTCMTVYAEQDAYAEQEENENYCSTLGWRPAAEHP